MSGGEPTFAAIAQKLDDALKADITGGASSRRILWCCRQGIS
jgi:hypothetical protein